MKQIQEIIAVIKILVAVFQLLAAVVFFLSLADYEDIFIQMLTLSVLTTVNGAVVMVSGVSDLKVIKFKSNWLYLIVFLVGITLFLFVTVIIVYGFEKEDYLGGIIFLTVLIVPAIFDLIQFNLGRKDSTHLQS